MEHVKHLYSETKKVKVDKNVKHLEDIERLVRDGMFNTDTLK